jgi:hypothetical protein
VRKWVQRFRAEGSDGLLDRSSRPHHSPARTGEEAQREVERLRRLRWTCDRIAQATGVSRSTVSRVLRRLGLNRLKAIEPAEPVQRYEHDAPGDLLHLDIKSWERLVLSATGSRGIAASALRASAGNTCTLPLTTIPGSPSPLFTPMNAALRLRPFCSQL